MYGHAHSRFAGVLAGARSGKHSRPLPEDHRRQFLARGTSGHAHSRFAGGSAARGSSGRTRVYADVPEAYADVPEAYADVPEAYADVPEVNLNKD